MLSMHTTPPPSTPSSTPATDAVKRLWLFRCDDPTEMTDEEVIALLTADGIDVNAAVAELKSKIAAAFARLDAEGFG